MEVSSPIFPMLTLKLFTLATSLEPSEKGGQIGNLRSYGENLVKICPVDPEIALLNGPLKIIQKKEINASKT